MIIEEFEDDYSNFFYNNTNTNNSKTGIFGRPNLKQRYSNSLKDDIDEYLNVLNINKNYQNENNTLSNKHIQNSTESIIKKPSLANIFNVTKLKCENFKNSSSPNRIKSVYERATHLILKDDLFNIENDKSSFIFLSPESDIDTNNLFLNDLNTQKNLTNSSKCQSFRKQEFCFQYRYIVPVERFYSYIGDKTGNGRPRTAKKLIESPKTENTETSNLSKYELSSVKEYTCLPNDSNGGSEHQETDNKSIWILKVQLWINKVKQTKNHISKIISKSENSSNLQRMDLSAQVVDMFNTTFKSLDQYSKFFTNEQTDSVGNSLVLQHNPKNSTNMILRQTSFDDLMIKIHHQHYLFLKFLSPINCAFCLRYVRENDLEDELKQSRYFHLYKSIEKKINMNIDEYQDMSNEKFYESSLFNLWNGIKREISFKLKKSDSKSIKTIGSLKSPKTMFNDSGKNECLAVISKNSYYKPKAYHPLTKKKLKKLIKLLLNGCENLDVVKNNITEYPILKDRCNQAKNKDVILLMTDQVFKKKLYLWNLWFWKCVANGCLNVSTECSIKCINCGKKILSSMESLLFRYEYNSHKGKLCRTCQIGMKNVCVNVTAIFGNVNLPLKFESDETLHSNATNVESQLEDEQHFDDSAFIGVVNLMQT